LPSLCRQQSLADLSRVAQWALSLVPRSWLRFVQPQGVLTLL